MIKVLLFAHLRELATTSELSVASEDISTTRDLINKIVADIPALSQALSDESAMISVNKAYAGWDATVISGDEVGILPPVSGG